DESQTEGPDLPDVVSKLEGLAPDGVFEKLTVFAESIGFRVERPELLDSGANGDTSHASGRIRVVSSNSEAQQAKTLAHEIGHALLHDPESPATKDLTRGLKELEAESIAYVVAQALGMDTSDYSFGYVAGWAGGGPEAIAGIKESAARIQKASTAVLKTFEVEEPAVEVVNDAGVDLRLPQLVAEVAVDAERDLTQDHGDPRVDEPTGPVQIEVREVESPDERNQVNSVELSIDDEQVNKYRPLSSDELEVLGATTLGDREVGLER
ncbi:MAG: ImmA/IrrE family metallo-endopeptidase, partial [Acidimicrobiales bacterium]